MREYLEISFKIEPAEGRDILLALLDNLNYGSFEETAEGLKAYILEKDFDEEKLKQLYLFDHPEYRLEYSIDRLENKNWNEEWESFYAPILIDDQVHIRASFHESKPEIPLEILITPKMSFGTGHHQTTRLMTKMILGLEIEGKKVLDMGTGTGILAIVAEKRGAQSVEAIDNFEWAVENAAENAQNNHCTKINALHGDAELLAGKKFDIVLANINRNVLLEDMKFYTNTLPTGGQLVISGFFEDDFEIINQKATECGAELVGKIKEGRWLACHYQIA